MDFEVICNPNYGPSWHYIWKHLDGGEATYTWCGQLFLRAESQVVNGNLIPQAEVCGSCKAISGGLWAQEIKHLVAGNPPTI